jgi:hypothetical protein
MMDPTLPPDFTERRKDAAMPLLELLKNIQHSVDDLNLKFDKHVVTQRDELTRLVAAAFPVQSSGRRCGLQGPSGRGWGYWLLAPQRRGTSF